MVIGTGPRPVRCWAPRRPRCSAPGRSIGPVDAGWRDTRRRAGRGPRRAWSGARAGAAARRRAGGRPDRADGSRRRWADDRAQARRTRTTGAGDGCAGPDRVGISSWSGTSAVIADAGIDEASFQQVRRQEEAQLAARVGRYGEQSVLLADRTVVLVDDGLATGMTALAAVAAARSLRPARSCWRSRSVAVRRSRRCRGRRTRWSAHWFRPGTSPPSAPGTRTSTSSPTPR